MGGAFYTSMLDAVSDGVVAFSPDRRIIYCNQAFLDITGLDRSDLEHGLCAVMRGADTDLHTIAKIDEALANGKPFDGEVLNYRKSGEAFWNHLSFKPETDATGNVTHFIGISRDVTANRSTQTRFSQLERDYEFICENVLAGIIIRDPDSRVRYINPKAREMLGLTGDVTLDAATVERGWQLLRPDGSVMPTEEYPFYRALRERATVRGVLLGHRRTLDDKIVWALCDAFLANDDKGDVAGVLVSFTDVSRLIESEQTAHAYRERFELAARASQDVIFEWNIETGAFSANEAFKNVYGYEPPQIMGPGNLDARNAVETDQYAVRDITLKAIASGNERFSVDHMINRPDGSIGHLVIRAFIVRNPQGEALRVIGTVTVLVYADVDGLKLINDQFGHDAGDRALSGLAHRMKNTIRKDDIFARIGGDEFAIILKVRDTHAAELVAKRLNDALNLEPLTGEIDIRCSLGVLVLPKGSKSIDAELKQADTLMYRAKQAQAGMMMAISIEGDMQELAPPASRINSEGQQRAAVRSARRATGVARGDDTPEGTLAA